MGLCQAIDAGHRRRPARYAGWPNLAAPSTPTLSSMRNDVRRSNASVVSMPWPPRSADPTRPSPVPVRRHERVAADVSKKLKNVKAQDIMKRARVLRPDGTQKNAFIRIKGGVVVRNGADE